MNERLVCSACGWHWPHNRTRSSPPDTIRVDCVHCGARMHYKAMDADPDGACAHEDFEAQVDVTRITETDDGPVVGYSAAIRVCCAHCREPFRWTGLQAGDMPSRPMCFVDETELRAPLRPASSDPDFGLGLAGFAVKFTQPPTAS